MLGAIYISQSGMTAYSTGLDVISNNVANLNTAGFKVNLSQFSSEMEENDAGALTGVPGTLTEGAGVRVATGEVSFQAGQLQNTGNPLDAAIDGNGFFVLQKDGQQLYTRAGEFEFDKDGNLVDTATQAQVFVRTDASGGTTFNINDYRVDPPVPTTTVTLTGTLAQAGAGTFTMPPMTLIDSGGASEQVTLTFTPASSGASGSSGSSGSSTWSVSAKDASGKSLGTGTLQFGPDGTPVSGDSSMTLTLSPANLAASTITVNFGSPGSYTGVTSITGNTISNVSLEHQDGVALGALTGVSFDNQGRLTLAYSNGSTKTPATLLLAQFAAPQQLKELNGGLFTTVGTIEPQLGVAQSAGLGSISGGEIEQSNVDLTQQFSSLIIIERGYQACSQTTSIADQMIQQLLQMGQRG
jgi:flagellar hook protein FlgE